MLHAAVSDARSRRRMAAPAPSGRSGPL